MQKKAANLKFIIITESKDFQREIMDILADHGYTTLVENNYSVKDIYSYSPILLKSGTPDFVIVCFRYINTMSITLIKKIKHAFMKPYVIVIAEENPLKQIQSLCLAGADGFLFKQEIKNLHNAIHTILSGKRYLNQILLNCLFQTMLVKGSDTYDEHIAIFNFTEHQVFQLIKAGYSEEIIAEILNLRSEEVTLYKNRLHNKCPDKHVCENV